jgi:peptidoglycan/xylan/chitin deacetylase (PgdA/CDA1 family)
MRTRLLHRPALLVYHGIAEASDRDDPKRLLTSPEHLEAHLRFLQRRGYRFLTAEELLGEGAPSPRTAVVTFDDGWRNWLTGALPVLERLSLRATFYVCPGLFGLAHPELAGPEGALLDEEGTSRLAAAGMELGSHSLTHPDLRKLDEAALGFELVESKAAVERITGRPCRTFAYPYGLYDERVVQAVADAGYELAFRWHPGPWRPLEAPRLPAPPRHGARRLALKLAGFRRRGR